MSERRTPAARLWPPVGPAGSSGRQWSGQGTQPAPLRLLSAEHPGRLRRKRLGVSDAGARRSVALSVADARHHTHVVGATGSGKSTLLVNLILADALAGRGVVVLDPKGDLVTDILARLPESAGERLVLLDPAEQHSPAALNVLDTAGRDPELVVDHLVARRLARSGRGVCCRRLRAGFLASAPELAALAHLPAEPAGYGLPAAPARHVAPPFEVTRADVAHAAEVTDV